METIKEIVLFILESGKDSHKMLPLSSVKIMVDILNDNVDNYIYINNGPHDQFFPLPDENISEEHLLKVFGKGFTYFYKLKGKEVILKTPYYQNNYLNWKNK